MGIEKKVYSFRLDEALVEQLRVRAREENRSLSNYIETVLKQHLVRKDAEKTAPQSPD